MKVRLKGMKLGSFKKADGSKVTYFYAWRAGPRLNHEDGSPITSILDPYLHVAYTKAHAELKKPKGDLAALIAAFLISGEFKKLSDASKRDYRNHIKRIETKWGHTPIAALEDQRMRGAFKDWRDLVAGESGDRTADYVWTVLARILSVAKDRGKLKVNICERGGRLYDNDRSDKVWTDTDEAKYYTKAHAHMHLPLLIALWTGQREGDILKLTWMQYDGKYIRLEQSKGKKGKKRRVVIPVGAPLKFALDTLKAKTMEENGGKPLDGVICKTMRKFKDRPDGRWTEDGFRTSFAKNCDRAGIVDLTFHDARGTAVTRLALANATVPEIATITGHSLKTVQEILDKHYLNRDIKLADSAMMKLEVSKGIVRIAGLSVVEGGRG
jgi:integrase